MVARRVVPFGEEAIALPCDGPEEARALAAAVSRIPGVLEAVPGYERVVAHLVSASEQRGLLARLAAIEPLALDEATSRAHEVRVIYDGPDLVEVAHALGRTPRDVADLHARSELVVEVIGFLPGFAYLGGLDPRLERPRRRTPRPRVRAGTVAIAGLRSAIYPLDSPGGWNLLGRAVDFAAFDPTRTPPSAFAVGDRVRFVVEDVRC